eukprot:TRINITY_DN9348_c1_g5_i1.p1 TRINITY_DN9348_c1_g5~~TRINITY_DN9348_c1_g5_i1.p1  ORF type:complete len:1629 (+),score=560.14 TRINITY_DN9348_c1_g5_i1:82-4887(+)
MSDAALAGVLAQLAEGCTVRNDGTTSVELRGDPESPLWELTADGAKELAAAMEQCKVRSLVLGAMRISPGAAEVIASFARRHTSLRRLDLSYCRLGPALAQVIVNALTMGSSRAHVSELSLSYCGLGIAAMCQFAKSLDSVSTKLQHLCLKYNPITAQGLGLLLSWACTLHSIDARYCGILDRSSECSEDRRAEGMEFILEGLRQNVVCSSLLLQGNGFTDDDAAQILAAVKENRRSQLSADTVIFADGETQAAGPALQLALSRANSANLSVAADIGLQKDGSAWREPEGDAALDSLVDDEAELLRDIAQLEAVPRGVVPPVPRRASAPASPPSPAEQGRESPGRVSPRRGRTSPRGGRTSPRGGRTSPARSPGAQASVRAPRAQPRQAPAAGTGVRAPSPPGARAAAGGAPGARSAFSSVSPSMQRRSPPKGAPGAAARAAPPAGAAAPAAPSRVGRTMRPAAALAERQRLLRAASAPPRRPTAPEPSGGPAPPRTRRPPSRTRARPGPPQGHQAQPQPQQPQQPQQQPPPPPPQQQQQPPPAEPQSPQQDPPQDPRRRSSGGAPAGAGQQGTGAPGATPGALKRRTSEMGTPAVSPAQPPVLSPGAAGAAGAGDAGPAATGEEAAHKEYLVHMPPKWQRYHNPGLGPPDKAQQQQRDAAALGDHLKKLHGLGIPAWVAEMKTGPLLLDAVALSAKHKADQGPRGGPLLLRRQCDFVKMFDWRSRGAGDAAGHADGDPSPSGMGGGAKRRRRIAVGRSSRMRELVTMMEEAEEKEHAKQETARLADIVSRHKERIRRRKERSLAVSASGSAATPQPSQSPHPEEHPRAATSLQVSTGSPRSRRTALELALEAGQAPPPGEQQYRRLVQMGAEIERHERIRVGDERDAKRRDGIMGAIETREKRTLETLRRVAEGLSDEPFPKLGVAAPKGWARRRGAGLLQTQLQRECGADAFLLKGGGGKDVAETRKAAAATRRQLVGAISQLHKEDHKEYTQRYERAAEKRGMQMTKWAETLMAEDAKIVSKQKQIQEQKEAKADKLRQGNLENKWNTFKRLEMTRAAEEQREAERHAMWREKSQRLEQEAAERWERQWDEYEGAVEDMYHWEQRAFDAQRARERQQAERLVSVGRSTQERLSEAALRRQGRPTDKGTAIVARGGGGAYRDEYQDEEVRKKRQQIQTKYEENQRILGEKLERQIQDKSEMRVQREMELDAMMARRMSPRRATLVRKRDDRETKLARALAGRRRAAELREERAEAILASRAEKDAKVAAALEARAEIRPEVAALQQREWERTVVEGQRSYEEHQLAVAAKVQADAQLHQKQLLEAQREREETEKEVQEKVQQRVKQGMERRAALEQVRQEVLSKKRAHHDRCIAAAAAEKQKRSGEAAQRLIRKDSDLDTHGKAARKMQGQREDVFQSRIEEKYCRFEQWREESAEQREEQRRAGSPSPRTGERSVREEQAHLRTADLAEEREKRQASAAQFRVENQRERQEERAARVKRLDDRATAHLDHAARRTLDRMSQREKKEQERERLYAERLRDAERQRRDYGRRRQHLAEKAQRRCREISGLREDGIFELPPVPLSPARTPSRAQHGAAGTS